MMRLFRSRSAAEETGNTLVAVVEPFDDRTRWAMFVAASESTLVRRTWEGCALNRAGALLGCHVTSKAEAAEVFHLSPKAVSEFVVAWDGLRGSNSHCTALLRDALVAVHARDEIIEVVADVTPERELVGV